MRVMLISDPYPAIGGWSGDLELVETLAQGSVPTRAQLEAVDAVFVLGQIGNQERARQLAGVINLALPRGLTAIIAYPTYVEVGLETLIRDVTGASSGRPGVTSSVSAQHPAFADYFAVFGQSGEQFLDRPGETETLGTLDIENPLVRDVSFVARRNGGLVYVVPFYFAGAEDQFIGSLFDAVQAHRDGLAGGTPDFLRDIRLPGEAELLNDVADAETELGQLQERASYFEKFRHLIGLASGSTLEALVIEALNVILATTDLRAEDREDVRAEDFWIVGPDGDVALAEVKGQNTHVRLDDVNQLDSHRDEAGEPGPGLPGLLIVNIFRGQQTLDQRQLPVAGQAIRRGCSSDVLILRAWDLFNLLHMAMAGEDAGAILVEALHSNGGWLEVAVDERTLHRT